MTNEMEKYRNKIYRKYKPRRMKLRKYSNGRRVKDPARSFWDIGVVVQFITIILMGLLMLFCTACAYVKVTFLGE